MSPVSSVKQTPTAKDNEKIFVLGVGCQKGGTSWLRAYLHALPECDFGFAKEYHVLDVLYPPYNDRFKKRQSKQLRTYLKHAKKNKITKKQSSTLQKLLIRVNFYQNIKHYFDYFTMLGARSKSTRVVGDVTPAYAILPEKALKKVRDEMTARGFTVKVVFLMRDPIERLHSAARMRLRDARASGKPLTESEGEIFTEMLADPKSIGRSKYQETIRKLDKLFAPEDIYYGFYEELFTDSEIKKVTDFLGIKFKSPDFGVRINTTVRTSDLSQELVENGLKELSSTYKFVAQRFPEKDIQGMWAHSKL